MRTANMAIATGAFLDERDEWPAAIRRASEEKWPSVELTAITEELFRSLPVYLSSVGMRLSDFARVSVHAPAVLDSSPTAVAQLVLDSGLPYDLIFHPDRFREEDALARLEGQAVFENMDVNKYFGRTPDRSVRTVSRRRVLPRRGTCLDKRPHPATWLRTP
ncbi:MAG: hypothetical protein H0X39_05495 [Actinobacteria bacterium]|nr:hypothetical protein [Actinomycetota bacterium]